jgi:hypothetical protein
VSQVEEGTQFGRLYTPGQAPLPTDHLSALMFAEASAALSAAGCAACPHPLTHPLT